MPAADPKDLARAQWFGRVDSVIGDLVAALIGEAPATVTAGEGIYAIALALGQNAGIAVGTLTQVQGLPDRLRDHALDACGRMAQRAARVRTMAPDDTPLDPAFDFRTMLQVPR